MVALDDIGCIDQLTNLRGIFEELASSSQLLRQERIMSGYLVPQAASKRSSSTKAASSVAAL